MKEVRVEEATLQQIADKVREKNKETSTYYPSELPDAIDRIIVTEMVIEPLHITANGDYTVEEGVHGYNPIKVEVPPTLEELEVTTNGEYTPTSTDGFSKVIVNTPMPTDEELVLTGECNYRFAYNGWDWVLQKFGDRITTKDITSVYYMFQQTAVKKIPFQINIKDTYSFNRFLYNAYYLRECPKIRGTIKWSTSTDFGDMLNGANALRDVEDFFAPEMLDGFKTVKVTSSYSTPKPLVLRNMTCLRRVPSWWYKFGVCPNSTAASNGSYTAYYYLGYGLRYLDEFKDIPVYYIGEYTSNMFSNAFQSMGRVSHLTFETNEDGSPIVAKWRGQTLDLSIYFGYVDSTYIPSGDYYELSNSGITSEHKVTDDSSYQALKNDPDWFTTQARYSRYNHDSAVETINSLPDTSAYLASSGGTNTIKFKKMTGESTDGGAIETLTAEEIAVATAKGWTVTLVN